LSGYDEEKLLWSLMILRIVFPTKEVF
jgi:hypothetical protein